MGWLTARYDHPMFIKVIGYLGVLLVGLIIGASFGAGALWLSQTPFPIDEWVCVEGEAPVITGEGGSYCEAVDKQPKQGWRWDPLGNRPFICEDRKGWVEVTNGQETDCFSSYFPLPEGWSIKD